MPTDVAIPKGFRNPQEIATPVCELARNDRKALTFAVISRILLKKCGKMCVNPLAN